MLFSRALEIIPTINPDFMHPQDREGLADAAQFIQSCKGRRPQGVDVTEYAGMMYDGLTHLHRRTTSEHYKEIIEAVLDQYIAVYNS